MKTKKKLHSKASGLRKLSHSATLRKTANNLALYPGPNPLLAAPFSCALSADSLSLGPAGTAFLQLAQLETQLLQNQLTTTPIHTHVNRLSPCNPLALLILLQATAARRAVANRGWGTGGPPIPAAMPQLSPLFPSATTAEQEAALDARTNGGKGEGTRLLHEVANEQAMRFGLRRDSPLLAEGFPPPCREIPSSLRRDSPLPAEEKDAKGEARADSAGLDHYRTGPTVPAELQRGIDWTQYQPPNNLFRPPKEVSAQQTSAQNNTSNGNVAGSFHSAGNSHHIQMMSERSKEALESCVTVLTRYGPSRENPERLNPDTLPSTLQNNIQQPLARQTSPPPAQHQTSPEISCCLGNMTPSLPCWTIDYGHISLACQGPAPTSPLDRGREHKGAFDTCKSTRTSSLSQTQKPWRSPPQSCSSRRSTCYGWAKPSPHDDRAQGMASSSSSSSSSADSGWSLSSSHLHNQAENLGKHNSSTGGSEQADHPRSQFSSQQSHFPPKGPQNTNSGAHDCIAAPQCSNWPESTGKSQYQDQEEELTMQTQLSSGGGSGAHSREVRGVVLITGAPLVSYSQSDIAKYTRPYGTAQEIVLLSSVGKALVLLPDKASAKEMAKVYNSIPERMRQFTVELLTAPVDLSSAASIFHAVLGPDSRAEELVLWDGLLKVSHLPDIPDVHSVIINLLRNFGQVFRTLLLNDNQLLVEVKTEAMAVSVCQRFQEVPCVLAGNRLCFSIVTGPMNRTEGDVVEDLSEFNMDEFIVVDEIGDVANLSPAPMEENSLPSITHSLNESMAEPEPLSNARHISEPIQSKEGFNHHDKGASLATETMMNIHHMFKSTPSRNKNDHSNTTVTMEAITQNNDHSDDSVTRPTESERGGQSDCALSFDTISPNEQRETSPDAVIIESLLTLCPGEEDEEERPTSKSMKKQRLGNNVKIGCRGSIKGVEDESAKSRTQLIFPTDYHLPPFNPRCPAGMEFLKPKAGFSCQVCQRFYSGGEALQRRHCSSRLHHRNLQHSFRKWIQDKSACAPHGRRIHNA